MRKVIYYLLTTGILQISVLAYAGQQFDLDPHYLSGAKWSYSISYDQSMEGRTFYDHSGWDGHGEYLLKITIKLGNGDVLVRTERDESEDVLYNEAQQKAKLLADLQSNRLIPFGKYSCLKPYLTLRINDGKIKTIEKWEGDYDVVPCSKHSKGQNHGF
jgi:hypothetical protein